VTRRRRLSWLLAALSLVVVPAAGASIQLTPVQRLSFPERAFIVDIGRDGDVSSGRMQVSENGSPVDRFTIRPLATSSIDSAVILAVDASKSMAGPPYLSALAGARAFSASRTGAEQIGFVAFNDVVHVVQRPTASAGELGASLDHPPGLTSGTRIYDAVMESLELLSAARASTGAIVVLSDGADVGSLSSLDNAIAAARNQHVRIFTVGLATKSYDPRPLRALADETGGSYLEATSAVQVTPIYAALGQRLASQYLLSYKSEAVPSSAVTLRLSIDGVGSAAADYTAPKPSKLAPYHRSLLKRFLLSPAATPVLSLVIALLLGGILMLLLTKTRSGLVGRVEEFLQGGSTPTEQLKQKGRDVRAALRGSPRAQGWLAKVERDLEIADVNTPVRKFVALTAAGTVVTCFVLILISPVLIVVGLMSPLLARGWLRRKLRVVRDDFADQLPPNLQVLASALRAGHSFSGALSVMVENADEPSKRELQRAVNDDQLGIPADEAIRRVALRMKSRDLEQVALLSELQRTAGGNAAEVLDTVVETIRERADIRRLLRTLTAQGRMARWILTALPVFVAVLLTLIQPDVMRPLYTTTAGHVGLLIAALMVTAGSLVIQRIVDIEV
jgi:tight adherence protein B